MEKIYIFGHRNPDTDSVTAAITLSYLKQKLGYNAIPVVLSSINEETKYTLDYFKVPEPIFLNDIKTKIKDLNYTRKYSVQEKNSIYDAYYKMTEAGISKIPVVDKNKKLLGIVTMKNIAREQFTNNIESLNTTYENIIKVLKGKEILKFTNTIKGTLLISSYASTTFINSVKLNKNNILIVGDRNSIIEYAIKSRIKLIILTGNSPIKEEHLIIAKQNKINIIKTPYDTMTTSKMINLSNNIKTIDYEKNILCVKEYSNVSDFLITANKTRYSYYPVIDQKEQCTGILRLPDVNTSKKKKVILVDHNSYEQSAIGLDETEILEIIDHHNIGSIGTNQPINFRNMPVGSTNTIISILYKENNIPIPKKMAGLMLAGILSDTLILTSPTTTQIDKEEVIKLSKIAKINYKQFGLDMLKAGSKTKGKTKEEILYNDYKVYPVGNKKIGLGQISTTNPEEILEQAKDYIKLLDRVAENENYYFVALFITDIINQGSYTLYSKNAEEILRKVYKNNTLSQGTFLKNIISRKLQILPGIMLEMEN